MSRSITFRLKHEWNRAELAKIFNVYLVGSEAHKPVDTGPWEKEISVDGCAWQLNPQNDFFLHFEDDGSVRINHRYGSVDKLMAMFRLFAVMYEDVDGEPVVS